MKLEGLRNLQPLSIATDADCIIFTGINGSGKTSLLEGIYLLSRCASFRTKNLSSLINYNSNELSCFGEIRQKNLDKIGLVRSRSKRTTKLNLNGTGPRSISDIASVFPTLLITPYTFQLIEGGPKERRKLLDWGLFHVEPAYKENWRKWRKVLLQRNGLLKNDTIPTKEIDTWDDVFLEYSNRITKQRQKYFNLLLKNFRAESQPVQSCLQNSEFFKDLVKNTELDFYQGWSQKKTLKDVIRENSEFDRRLRSTKFGPQRADMVVKTRGHHASEIFSRGQLKVLITKILLAQLRIIREYGQNSCTVLVDDIGAELDKNNQLSLLESILEEKAQVIVTVLDENHATELYESLYGRHSVKMFHVKHGQISSFI